MLTRKFSKHGKGTYINPSRRLKSIKVVMGTVQNTETKGKRESQASKCKNGVGWGASCKLYNYAQMMKT